MVKRYQIPVTTNSSGAFTGYTEEPVNGRVLQVAYAPGAAPIDTGGDIDITLETTGVVVANHDNIGTAAFTKVYKQATHGVDGAASLYAAGGVPVNEFVVACNERLKLVVANGGDTKSGTFYIWVG